MSKRLRATMRPNRSVPKYIKQCRVILGKMMNNPRAPNPPLPVADVQQHVDELDQAEQDAHDGGLGTATDRDDKLAVVEADMAQMIAYMEAEGHAGGPEGEAILESVGLYVVKRTKPVKDHLTVKHGAVTGAANLIARASKRRAAYHWQQMRPDQTWADLPETVLASTSVSGLTPGMIYSFRFRTLSVDGLSEWSAPVSFIAH